MELHCIFNDNEHSREVEFARQNSSMISDEELLPTILEIEGFMAEVEELLEREANSATLSDDDVADYAKQYWRAKFLHYYLRLRLPNLDEDETENEDMDLEEGSTVEDDPSLDYIMSRLQATSIQSKTSDSMHPN